MWSSPDQAAHYHLSLNLEALSVFNSSLVVEWKYEFIFQFWALIPQSVEWLGYRLDPLGIMVLFIRGGAFVFFRASRALLGSPQPPMQWALGLFPKGEDGHCLKMHEQISPFPHMSSWCCAKLSTRTTLPHLDMLFFQLTCYSYWVSQNIVVAVITVVLMNPEYW